jgi:uncharacterized membrane protein
MGLRQDWGIGMIRAELRHLMQWRDRHRRLVSRLVIALALTAAIDVIASVLMWLLERHVVGTDIHSLSDGLFFSTTQLLTISSQLRNPLTALGRVVDVSIQLWAIVVVAAIAGSFASFFITDDRDRTHQSSAEEQVDPGQ